MDAIDLLQRSDNRIRPEQIRDVAEALRAIAVIEERMIRLDENIARIGAAVGRLEQDVARADQLGEQAARKWRGIRLSHASMLTQRQSVSQT